MPIPITCPSCGKRLTAPDAAAGKQAKCPGCGTLMIVPELVHEAEEIGAEPLPQQEYDVLADLADGQPSAASAPPDGAAEGGPPRRACPMCGEMIVATAAKCRFCGAIFDPTLYREDAKKRGRDEHASLTTGDWIFCILCAGLACIFGIVYAIQGKPKGMKMVGVSLVAAVVWNILNAILQVAIHSGPQHPFR